MKIFKTIESNSLENAFFTIGSFDGVHLGHKKLINRLLQVAKQHNSATGILTFWPHPRYVLGNSSTDLKLLNSIEERTELIEKLGIDYLIVYPFTLEFSKLSAKQFIEEILVNTLKIKGLIIGYDHHFGHKRQGEVNCIAEAAQKHGFYLEQVEAFSEKNINLSSTKIRTALEAGDIALAESFLSYKYSLSGKVVHGKKIGRNIGFPTANLETQTYKLIPGKGVYAVEVSVNKQLHYGMANIGNKPTVNKLSENVSIEVHLFDFDEDIYNREIKIVFLKKIRNEHKFEDLDSLKKQIQKDRISVHEYLKLT